MAFFLATLISLGCIFYSMRSLRATLEATAIDPALVSRALRIAGASAREKVLALYAWAKKEPRADLEADLLEAVIEHRGEAQVALVNAVLGEVDHRVQSQLRIPRVCARVSSTVGLLCGAMALRQGLVEGSLDVSPLELITRGPIADMLAAVLMGIAGATWCMTAARIAKKASKERLEGQDSLVERLEGIMMIPGANSEGPPAPVSAAQE